MSLSIGINQFDRFINPISLSPLGADSLANKHLIKCRIISLSLENCS